MKMRSSFQEPILCQNASDQQWQSWRTAASQLSWDDLRIVKTLIDCKSRSVSAEKLGLNVSTVTRRVALVEQALGITLFNRRRAGYTLTAEGLELQALCERVELDIVSVVRCVSGSMQGPLGKLRITTSDSLLYFLTPIIADFKTRHTSTTIEVLVSNSALNLARDESDIAFRATQKPPENLIGRKLANIAWAPYGRTATFSRHASMSEMLYDRVWISYAAHLSSLKASEYVQDRVAPENIQYLADSVVGVKNAIVAGIGVGFLPCMFGDSTPGLMRVGPVIPELDDTLWLLTHPDIRKSQRVKSFMSFCADEVAKRKNLIEGRAEIAGR